MDLMSARFVACMTAGKERRGLFVQFPGNVGVLFLVEPNIVVLFLGNNGVTLFLLALDAAILMLKGIREESHGS